MMEDIGPRKASPGLRLRTLGSLMIVIALCGLAFAAARPRPEARSGPAFPAPRALPIPTAGPILIAGLDDRFVHPAPRGLDDRFVVAARAGLDDGIIVDPGRMTGRIGASVQRGPRMTPVPAPGLRVIPLPGPMAPPPYPVPLPGAPFRRPGPPSGR